MADLPGALLNDWWRNYRVVKDKHGHKRSGNVKVTEKWGWWQPLRVLTTSLKPLDAGKIRGRDDKEMVVCPSTTAVQMRVPA